MITTAVALDADVVDRIHAVAPLIGEGALAAERLRTPEPSMIAEVARQRLFALQAPREVGGDEIDPLLAVDAFELLASLDTSVGWCVAVGSTGAAVLGSRLSPPACDVVFANGVPRVAGTFAPTGVARRVDGGYLVTGRWSFASGIHHAEWVTGGCITDDPEPSAVTVVVPKDAVTVSDNWHVAGLQGTGSCDWTLTDHFVPDDYVISAVGPAVRGGAVFSLPLFCFIGSAHAGFALGCARRSLSELVAAASTKTRFLTAGSVALSSAFQRDFGRLDVTVRAARLVVRDALDAAWAVARDGGAVSDVLQAEIRAAATYATTVASDACTFAFRSIGGSALSLDNPIQRYFRDIHAAAQHAYVNETAFEDLARLRA
jgi:alkylation response protein AidB-like acyl-CoA dehydrogenase